MKKQFRRVKQLAEQTFSGGEKTEALSPDLIVAEKCIELLNKACQNVSRKISSSLLGSGQDTAAREKRITKSTEYVLGETLTDISCQGDLDDVLRDILVECSRIQMCLAQTSVDYDVNIESTVLRPLQEIIETDVPNITKQKYYLKKLILDMDSARNRLQAALKHISNVPTAGNTNKVDSIKEELEEFESKVEQCRDALACDMFQLIRKQAVLADVLLDYVKLQQTVHRAALKVMDEMVPELEAKIKNSTLKRVFGFPLEDHLKCLNRKIAYPLELCVCAILELGMEEEGLFRIAGGASKMRRLKNGFDVHYITMETAMEYRDVHVFTSVLKSYLRELPEPLLTYGLYDEWLATNRYSDEHSRKNALRAVLQQLPQANFDNLRYLIKFLAVLTRNQEITKMSTQNIAIVMAPNLLWCENMNSSSIGDNMNLVSQYSNIIECLVKNADWFFPGDESFYLTIEETNPVTKRHHRSSSADMHLLNVEYTSTTDMNSIKRCQSTTSLEDQLQDSGVPQNRSYSRELDPVSLNLPVGYSPQPESPKPITRTRKNKPAPTPPSPVAAAQPTATVTISQTPVKPTISRENSKVGAVKVSIPPSPKKFTYDVCNTTSSENSSVIRRQSFTFVDYVGRNETADEERSKVRQSRQAMEEELTKMLTTESVNKIMEEKRLGKPIPAPRTSIEPQLRANSGEDGTPRKPVIPEKPTTLPRPGSTHFKPLKISDSNDIVKIDVERGKGPSLEKAHLYTVDKQQVSFIDIDGSTQETGQENTTVRHPEMSELKPESASDRGQNSSHTRALSDGHSIDTSSSTTTQTYRSNYSRIQRPMPPPPPPPVTTKPPTRPGSVSDSTNL